MRAANQGDGDMRSQQRRNRRDMEGSSSGMKAAVNRWMEGSDMSTSCVAVFRWRECVLVLFPFDPSMSTLTKEEEGMMSVISSEETGLPLPPASYFPPPATATAAASFFQSQKIQNNLPLFTLDNRRRRKKDETHRRPNSGTSHQR